MCPSDADGRGSDKAANTVSLVPRLMAISPGCSRRKPARLQGLSPENAITRHSARFAYAGSAGVNLQSTAGMIELLAGDDLDLQPTSSLLASGPIRLQVDYGDLDPGVGATAILSGSVNGNPATLLGGADD